MPVKVLKRNEEPNSSCLNTNYSEHLVQLVALTEYENISEDVRQKLTTAECLCESSAPSTVDCQFFNILGQINMRLNHYNSAIKSFQTALKGNRQELSILINLGICHSQCGDYDSALNYFQEVIEVDPLIAWNRFQRYKYFYF